MSGVLIRNIRSYPFSPKEKVIFDTNIWMRLYGPYCFTKDNHFEYSEAFRNIRTNDTDILLNNIILSEFINAFSRDIWKHHPHKARWEEFKDFRNSPEFEEVAEEIGLWMKEIKEMVSFCDLKFDKEIAEGYIDKYLCGSFDFNDIIIAEFSKLIRATLITHDFDFRGCEDITIVTAYKKLLNNK